MLKQFSYSMYNIPLNHHLTIIPSPLLPSHITSHPSSPPPSNTLPSLFIPCLITLPSLFIPCLITPYTSFPPPSNSLPHPLNIYSRIIYSMSVYPALAHARAHPSRLITSLRHMVTLRKLSFNHLLPDFYCLVQKLAHLLFQ